MTRQPEEQAKRALEILAASVKIPAPPAGLAEARVSRRWPYALAAMLIIFISAATWQILRPGQSLPESPAPDVVVEYLRIHGKAVPSRILVMPEAGALLIMIADERTGTANESNSETNLATLTDPAVINEENL